MVKKKIEDYHLYTVTDPTTGKTTVHDVTDERQNPSSAISITQSQLEAWKKMPKEEAVKAVLDLIHDTSKDVSEKRFELDAYRFIAELQGAQAPVSQAANIIEIRISQPVIPEKRIIDVTAQEKKRLRKLPHAPELVDKHALVNLHDLRTIAVRAQQIPEMLDDVRKAIKQNNGDES